MCSPISFAVLSKFSNAYLTVTIVGNTVPTTISVIVRFYYFFIIYFIIIPTILIIHNKIQNPKVKIVTVLPVLQVILCHWCRQVFA